MCHIQMNIKGCVSLKVQFRFLDLVIRHLKLALNLYTRTQAVQAKT